MPQPSSFSFSAMASACNLHLYGDTDDDTKAAAEAAMAEVARIERHYSRYRTDSVLAAINTVARTGGSLTVDDETAMLLDYAYACYRRSEGLFDISSGVLRRAWNFKSGQLPDRAAIDALLPLIGLSKIIWQRPHLSFSIPGVELDFGGIGKEYAADQAAAVCRAMGIRHGLIELGGDVIVIGPHPDSRPWTIDIRHPRLPGANATSVMAVRGALASSGDYVNQITIDGRRYSHILNPLTGWPSQGLTAVSVMADSCLVAGSVATIAMLKGRAGVEWLAGLGLDHFYMDDDGNSGGTMAAPLPRS